MSLIKSSRLAHVHIAILTILTNTLCDASHPCGAALEGSCRQRGTDMVDICASGRWQRMPIGSNKCVNGTMQAFVLTISPIAAPASSSPHHSSILHHSSSQHHSSSPEETNGPGNPDYSRLTGAAECLNRSVPRKDNAFGRASYIKNGKMASAYNASDTFRCGGVAPADGMYAAVWTQYNGDPTGSQPLPVNCNESISLRNPKTGSRATAKIIDRCASCVGVGYQMADPTVPEYTINGATIDLSLQLWATLFENASLGVYDIEYDGRPHLGWPDLPQPLGKLTTSQCNG